MASGLLANFNNSIENSLFIKLTSQEPYIVNFRLLKPIQSSYPTRVLANNTLIYNQTVTNPLSAFLNLSLNRTTPCLCSFFVQISNSNNQLLSSFSLSARFVPYFLSADFIGFPGSYFTAPAGTLKSLNYSTYKASPGIFFYGEGHTDKIYLSAVNISPLATRYTWRINNSTTQYPVSTNTAQPHTSAVVSLTSDGSTNLRLPVSLHVTNTLFASTDPYFYRDDVTGLPVYYPYFSTTVDINGNELITNNRYRQSIRVKQYDTIEYKFDPGIAKVVNLPVNGSLVPYTASLKTAIEGLGALSACYDKYGYIWKWTTFEDCSAKQTQVASPSSWATVECSGAFPKLWRNLTFDEISRGLLSADNFSINPIACSATPINWTLSTTNWVNTFSATNFVNNIFPYYLGLEKIDLEKDYTTNFFENTNVTLNVIQTFTCKVSVTDLGQAPGYIDDWKPRNITLNLTHDILSLPPSVLKTYTSNRYVLTGDEVKFQNLFTNISIITGLRVNFDDNKTAFFTGDNVRQPYFYTSYEIIGDKTITFEAFTATSPTPLTYTFPDIIQVLTEYDDVVPTEYRSLNSPLLLPWKNKHILSPNDWVTDDNFNSVVKKFNENLEYLETRGQIYQETILDYFGHLGVQPLTGVTNVSSCDVWTWKDLNCLVSPLPYTITWRDVLSGETVFNNGKFATCGTWKQQTCTDGLINPTCFGKYDIFWQWKALKAGNSLRPITWADTGKISGGEFPKLWLYEPSINSFLVPCDEGLWNVNIPEIDSFYDPIPDTIIPPRCVYTGAVSRNNKLYLSQKTQIKLLSSDYNATFYSNLDKIDGIVGFSDIKNICLNSAGYIYILDGILNQVAVYAYDPDAQGNDWRLILQWGGFGTTNATSKFSSPSDIHIDQFDNVWVCDTGNGCIKGYSDLGTWIRTITDAKLKEYPPISLCIDSQRQIHILTNKNIRVYSYEGEFLFEYNYDNFVENTPIKINSSYNREVIYVVTKTEVIKFFRNGVFFSTILKNKQNVNNITGIFHDEYRNLLIISDDKILKYNDLMILLKLKGKLPKNYWQLNDLLVHEEEYVQNWVYTKALQRLWDNIEMFRNTLFYIPTSSCKKYKPPIHDKSKIIIGQNELVTSTVLNRAITYLWENFYTLVEYFDPNCQETNTP